MIIEVNKDIDRYKESVVMGLTARQLFFSVASVVVGGSIVLLLYRYVGMTVSAYIAIPAVAPIALSGFYSYNGMTFMQKMRKKLHFVFNNKPLTYLSTEGETEVCKIRIEELAVEKKADKKKSRNNTIDNSNKTNGNNSNKTNGNNRSNTDNKEDFETAKKGMVKIFIFLGFTVFSFIGFAVWYRYFR